MVQACLCSHSGTGVLITPSTPSMSIFMSDLKAPRHHFVPLLQALSSGVSSRQHQEIQNALLHAMVQCSSDGEDIGTPVGSSGWFLKGVVHK